MLPPPMSAENCYKQQLESIFIPNLIWSHITFLFWFSARKEFPVSLFLLIISCSILSTNIPFFIRRKNKSTKATTLLRWHTIAVPIHTPGRVWEKWRWKHQKRVRKLTLIVHLLHAKYFWHLIQTTSRVSMSFFLSHK